ncbi:hypothetical protein [Chroococcidiopsis cubana]|uniref:hypothetical protein n=1 Tax=Chroococcidiopsis cubana TaxID=171392 RepID=UPI0015E6E56B|nr:hypothetical protein [Chroococcidiopsis cubana]
MQLCFRELIFLSGGFHAIALIRADLLLKAIALNKQLSHLLLASNLNVTRK